MKKRVIIMGAAGRDFHNFLVYYSKQKNVEVVCFTAEQIPGIAKRSFPKKLAGKNYKKDIPIFSEKELPKLIKKYNVDEVCLSYSDIAHMDVMHKASLVLATGANFTLLGLKDTQVPSKKLVVSVTAVRTGCGKSQTSRRVAEALKELGYRIAVVRHPMPYGDLVQEEVQRFATYKDFETEKCTIEEREEYEPWVELGIPIYAGVNYEKILRRAEKEADVVIWDGGNNDFSFFKPDIDIVVTDPFRVGHELGYYPGETNLRSADVVVINKVNSAPKENIKQLKQNIKETNPKATIVMGESKLVKKDKLSLKGKKVLAVGDGPTLTHGGMGISVGTLIAKKEKAKMVNPWKSAVGSLKQLPNKYPHLKNSSELPAMGYSSKQIKELQTSINNSSAEIVVDGTPVSIRKLIKTNKEIVDVDYVLRERGKPTLKDVLKKLKKK